MKSPLILLRRLPGDGAAAGKWIDYLPPARAEAGPARPHLQPAPIIESARIDLVETDANQEDSPPGRGAGAATPPAAGNTYGDLPAPGRRGLGLLLLNAVLIVLAFGPLVTFDPEPTLEAEFEGVFFSPSDTSPSVVLLLAAWLLYRRRDRLLRLPVGSGSPWLAAGLLAFAGAILAWAVFVDVTDLRVLSLMTAILGFAALFGGRRALRIVALPAAFLLFAMPMPAPMLNAILFRMQFWTADFAGAILHAFGASAFVTGDQILREGNNFAIIETCSGVRIIETLTMLTILMLDLFRRRPLHSAILLALAPAVAFLCNGVRAVTLMLNPAAEIAEVHTLQGIGMLLGGLLLLYAVDGVLGRLLPSQPVEGPSPGPTAAGGQAGAVWQWRAATAALAVFASVSLAMPTWPRSEPRLEAFLVSDFIEIGPWRSSEIPVDRRFLGRIGFFREVSRRYFRGGDVVKLYAAASDREFRPRSVLFSKAVLPGSGWNTREQGTLRLEPGGIEASWRVVVSGTRKEFVVYWSEGGAGLLEESFRSLLGLDKSPLRRPGEALVVRLATAMTDPEEARALAEARILRFYDALRPELDAQHAILRGDTT